MKPNVKNRETLSLSVLLKMYILIFYGFFLPLPVNSAFTFYGCTIWYWTQVQSYSVHCCSAFITLHSRSGAPATSSTANIAWRKLAAQVQQSGGIPSMLHQQLFFSYLQWFLLNFLSNCCQVGWLNLKSPTTVLSLLVSLLLCLL